MEAYYQSLKSVRLYGPTHFSPVINHVARWVHHNQRQRCQTRKQRQASFPECKFTVKYSRRWTHSAVCGCLCRDLQRPESQTPAGIAALPEQPMSHLPPLHQRRQWIPTDRLQKHTIYHLKSSLQEKRRRPSAVHFSLQQHILEARGCFKYLKEIISTSARCCH